MGTLGSGAPPSTARVTGIPVNVARAVERLERTTLAVTVELKIKEPLYVMLTAKRAKQLT
mgnify:CR=1 FL=1